MGFLCTKQKSFQSKQKLKNKGDLYTIQSAEGEKKENKKHWGRNVKGKQKTFFKFLQHVK